MPIYEYVCSKCVREFEALVRTPDEARCPECGGAKLERLLSVPAVKSEGTRSLAMRAAKKRDAGQAKRRNREQLRYEQSHDRHG